MTPADVAFVIVAVVGSIAAFRLVTSRNVVRAARMAADLARPSATRRSVPFSSSAASTRSNVS